MNKTVGKVTANSKPALMSCGWVLVGKSLGEGLTDIKTTRESKLQHNDSCDLHKHPFVLP